MRLRADDTDPEERGATRDEIDRLPLARDSARLSEDGRVPCEVAVVREPLRAVDRSRLLVGGEHDAQASRLGAGAGQGDARVQHPGDGGLHVGGPEAPQLAVDRCRIPRIVLPGVEVARGLGVEVARDDERSAGFRAEVDDDVRAVRLACEDIHGSDVVARELLLDAQGSGPLVARWVGTGCRDEGARERRQLAVEPVDDPEQVVALLLHRHGQSSL